MAGILVATNTAALTANATTAGVITIANSALFPAGSVCWLSGDALTSVKVKVIKVTSTTTVVVRILPTDPVANMGHAPVYSGPSDVSAFTLAANSKLNVEQQVVDEYAPYHYL